MKSHTKMMLMFLLMLGLVLPLLSATTANKTVSWLSAQGLSPVWIIIIISMLPIIELRGSIPIAIMLFKMSWQEAVFLSVIGNMLPIPFILLFMDWFFARLNRSKQGAKFTSWLFTRTRKKGKSIEKYESIGLAVFVGIPLPGTGAWTGAFAANIFGLKFWSSLLFIFIGVLLAAAVVTMLSLMGNMAIR